MRCRTSVANLGVWQELTGVSTSYFSTSIISPSTKDTKLLKRLRPETNRLEIWVLFTFILLWPGFSVYKLGDNSA